MKIRIVSPTGLLHGLRCRLQFQGHEIVEELSRDHDDVTIEESKELASAIVHELGMNPIRANQDYFISKFWTATSWSEETLLSFHLNKLLPGDLGPLGAAGAVCRRCEKPLFERLFEQPALKEFLKLSGHIGFFSLGMSKCDVVSAHMGIPGMGFYGFCQMAFGALLDHLVSEPKMPKEWMTSLVLARWPYPDREETRRIRVEIPSKVFEHFWPWARVEGFCGNSFQTTDTLIGVATSFGDTLEHSMWFAETTCKRIEVENKLYHKNGFTEVDQRVWKTMQIVDQG